MKTSADLTGQRTGRLVALRRANVPGKARWVCRCDCGVEKVVRAVGLRSGRTKSCGCYRRDACREVGKRFARTNAPAAHAATLKHGHSRRGQWSRVYQAWTSMRTRCGDPTCSAFKHYGGRGIAVCARWETFENFLADMGEPGPGLSLERRDVNAGYEPANCRWATTRDQSLNKRTTIWVELDGERMTVVAACERTGVKARRARERIAVGWDPVEAVTTPIAEQPMRRAS